MIDVVIPARNEAPTITNIITAFANHEKIATVHVVVDTDTTDDTLDKCMGMDKVVGYQTDYLRGKGQLCKWAVDNFVATERVLFCDADLTGLTSAHVSQLTEDPSGQTVGVADWPTYAVFDSGRVGPVPSQWKQRLLWSWPWVSGVRCVPTRLSRSLDLHGYLMEVQINEAIRRNHMSTHFVRLHGLHSPFRLTTIRLHEMQRDLEYMKKEGARCFSQSFTL